MKTIFSEETEKIIKNKRKLEGYLKVKIAVNGKDVIIDGSPENEYSAEKTIDAINLGFPVPIALLIKQEEFLLERIDIKKYTPRKDYETIRARIIGTKGKTLRTLATLTECYFEIKNNEVGIIGSPERIKNAQDAIISLVQGSKQANVYAFLEKHQVAPILDLGLKNKNDKKKIRKKSKAEDKEESDENEEVEEE
jgi:KH domain-containing protein